MTSELATLQAAYSRLEFALPHGVIHGDASIGNVLSDPGGHPVVIDLDDFATGPREWDLIQTAIYYDRFGWHTREEYETFTKVYGYDIMQWPGYPVLADIREFIMATWIIQKAAESEKITAEARKRVDALRTGASRRDWLPF
jgi:aminoglycoside phosphotransferase (APT) family kinase protein